MPVSKNTWNKGLNSDLSKLKSQQDSYLDAKNIRVLTDIGSTSLAIENIKGNTFSFNLPAAEATYKIDYSGIEGSASFILQRQSQPPYTFTIDNVDQKTNEGITNELNIQMANSSIQGNEVLKFYYNSDYIVLYDFKPSSVTYGSINVYNVGDVNVISKRTNRIPTHTILGWGYYNNTLVIISCPSNSNSEIPEDVEGFIWAATYNNQTDSITSTDIDGNYLLPITTLKYAGKLNLSRQYAISKHLKCRYENVETARIVWTDWHNDLRTCNILDPQIWATPEELFSYIPRHLPQKPIVSAVITGGTIPTCKIQYFYQLYSNQGAKSTFSPISNLITLYPGDNTNYTNTGALAGTNSQKSVQITLQNIDVNYDTIRTGYVIYQIADFPEAFFFDERLVPDNGQLTIVHNGNENDIPLDSTEIANLNRTPEVFKTIDVVKNRLFAANARTTYFDLTEKFDARAYRYDSNRIAKLYNTNDTYSTPSVVIDQIADTITINNDLIGPIDYDNFLLIPETFDCINPFNQESNVLNQFANGDWATNSQYKYNYLGTSIGGKIGGTGPNISYEFTTVEQIARIGGSWTTSSPYINPATNYVSTYQYEFSDTYSYPGGSGSQLDTMKSPYLETLFTGYSRGEVYRFGIVFYDRNGYPSYVNWIGDIKFPFTYDNFGEYGFTKFTDAYADFLISDSTNIPSDGVGINLTPGTAGVNYDFIVDGSTIYTWSPTAISTMEDFCVAFNAGNTLNITVTQENSLDLNELTFTAPNNDPIWNIISFYIYVGSLSETSITYTFQNIITDNVILKQLGITFSLDTQTPQFQAIKDKISGWSYVRLKRELPDRTRLGTGVVQNTVAGNNNYLLTPITTTQEWNFGGQIRLGVQVYYSPNMLLKRSGSWSDGDYMRFIGRTYITSGTQSQFIQVPVYPSSQIAYYIAASRFDYTYTDAASSIPGGVATNPIPTSTLYNKFNILGRLWVDKSSNENFVIANTIIDLNNPFVNMANYDFAEANANKFTEWGAQCELLTFASLNPDTTINYNVLTNPLCLYLGSYERYLVEQYNGADRAARYNNEYILTNHFMPYPYDTNIITTPQVTNDVYGGDTWVNYFDWQRTNLNYFAGSGYDPGEDTISSIATALFFPAECNFNSELNTQKQHASVRQNTDTVDISNYVYNQAYSQENTTNIFLSKGYLQSNIIEEPHTIYPSEPKLDGEQLDSWRGFLVNNALTVNGNYGEINRVIQFKDKLLYYQNDGIGVAAVDERVLANEGDTTQTQLGTGTVLQRYDYISTETGSKHSFAVETSGGSVYHYDSFINKMFKLSLGEGGMSPLTDIKGLSGFFRTAFLDSSLKSEDKILRLGNRVGISTGYNSEYNTIYFTFFDQANFIKHTIAYNELLDAFESFYDFYPSLYINMRKRFLSLSPASTFSKVYIHNTGIRNIFYDQNYSSSVKFRVNENSDLIKTFDNIWVNSEVVLNNIQLAETISTIAISNDYQIVNEQNANFTQKIRTWRLQVPRDETNPLLNIKPRISDKYMDVTFTFDTLNLDKQFVLHDVMAEYSMRSKILPN